MKKINFADPFIGKEERKFLLDAYNSKWISLGKYNKKLEEESAKLFKKKYALSVSNGTIAINLALLSLNLDKDDEVIVPSLCYISPINVLKSLNFKIKVCKIDHSNFQIDLDHLNKAITKKTKAILLIYNYGNLPDLEKIKKISKKNKIFLIEDFSEALFSKYKKVNAGSVGDISTASFHATKTITSGEGGIVLTNNKNIYTKMKKIREHGYYKKNEPYTYDMLGFNYKMSNLLAAIGYGQLRKNKEIIKKKKSLFKSYLKFLNYPNIKNLSFLNKNETPIMWSIPYKVNSLKERNKLIKILASKNIQVRPSFNMIYNYRHLNIKKIKEDNISEKIILLPMHLKMSTKNVHFICQILNKYSTTKF